MSSDRSPAEAVSDRLGSLPERVGAYWGGRELSKRLVLGGIVFLVALLTVVPLAFLLWTSVWSGYPGEFGAELTLENFEAVYLGDFFPIAELVINSLTIAVGMTATGMAFGLGAAWLFVRTDLPTKGEMELVLLSCQAVPGYVYAIMYVTAYGSDSGLVTTVMEATVGVEQFPIDIFSPWGIAFIAGINVVPTFYLLTVPALQNMDPVLEEASRIHGASMVETIRSISFPLIKPAILSATIVIFLYGLGEFAVVSILGTRNGFDVFSTAILSAINGRFPPGYGEAAALSCLLLVAMFVLVWYYRQVTARKEAFMTFSGRRHRSHVWSLGRWRWPLAVALWGGLFLIWVFPILVLLAVSVHDTWYGRLDPAALTLDNYYVALTDPNIQQAFTNSLLVAVGGATLGTVLVVGTAYYTERTDGRLRGVVDFLTLTPLAVPGIIVGAGLLFTFLWVGRIHPVLDLYGTLAIIVVGCVVVFLPVSSRIAVGNIVQIHSDLEEAARISGATWLGQMREIFLPLFKNTTIVIWFFLAMHVIQLLSIPLITYTSDTVVIPVRLYQLYMYEPGIALVAAISSIFILLTIGSLIGLRRLGVTFYELGDR